MKILDFDAYDKKARDPAEAGGNKARCGWILYTKEESVRNRPYIDLYRRAGELYQIKIALGIYKPPVCWDEAAKGELRRLWERARPAFIINRTRDYRISEAFESFGAPVYNSSLVARLGNDKKAAYRFMQGRDIPIMPTVYGLQMPKQFPVIVKSAGGHGGTEVFYISDKSQWQEFVEWKRSRPEEEYIIQKPASDLGRDLRVYIVGNQIKAALLRTSSQDFRSNHCLGGKEERYELSPAQKSLVYAVAKPLDIGMAGIDFLFHHGQLVFNEIEDMAGARGLYELTDYDIAQDYIRYICSQIFG